VCRRRKADSSTLAWLARRDDKDSVRMENRVRSWMHWHHERRFGNTLRNHARWNGLSSTGFARRRFSRDLDRNPVEEFRVWKLVWKPESSPPKPFWLGWIPKFPDLLADAELPNDSFIALGIVSLEVVEQATPLADQHKQAAA
jgi:hypothetical protein